MVRNWVLHYELDETRRAGIAERRPKGVAALAVMEGHLQTRHFFVGERDTIADTALYAYTHVAPEGGGRRRATSRSRRADAAAA